MSQAFHHQMSVQMKTKLLAQPDSKLVAREIEPQISTLLRRQSETVNFEHFMSETATASYGVINVARLTLVNPYLPSNHWTRHAEIWRQESIRLEVAEE